MRSILLVILFIFIFGPTYGQEAKFLTIDEQVDQLTKQLNYQQSIMNLYNSMLTDSIQSLTLRFDRMQVENTKLKEFIELNPYYACHNSSNFGFNKKSNGKYYKVGDLMLNWLGAEEYCQKYNAHLPSVFNKTDLDVLRSLIDDRLYIPMFIQGFNVSSESGYFLGGYRNPNETSWRWTNGNLFNYTQFGIGEPNNKAGNEYYLHDYYSLGKWIDWNDIDNLVYMHVICQLDC
jgi:hypothetical protein